MNRHILQKYWLKRTQKGDTESFVKLYDEFADKIYRFSLFKVNSIEDAEDITSQVFLKLWRYFQESNTEVKSIRAFVYRITRNLIIDYYRTRPQSLPLEYLDNDAVEEVLGSFFVVGQEKTSEQTSDLRVVYRALNTLKDEYREIIILKYIEDLSTKEICLVLNKNANAVRAHLYRALKALKESLPNDNHERTGVHTTTKKITGN